MNLESANRAIEKAVSALEKNQSYEGKLRVGIDLGTAYIVLVVIDEADQPVAVEMEFAKVLKDGLVVDYTGACQVVRRLKQKLEERLNVELVKASIAVPPGTGHQDIGTHRYVVESAGFEVTAVVDEPTAANAVMKLKDGVIVDVGGGTTGLSILKDGEVIYTADEATGGTHVTLVLSGHYRISFDEAEDLKKNISRQQEVVHAVRPVFEKMASIVKRHIEGYEIQEICLVGGTCLLPDVEQIFEKATGIKTFKPEQPLLVTPLGIALLCEK